VSTSRAPGVAHDMDPDVEPGVALGDMPGVAPGGGTGEAPGSAPQGTGAVPVRKRRVLWTVAGAGVVAAALIALFSSAQPSTSVLGSSPLLGKPAPQIAGPGLAGGHYSLSQFHGKWVLVNFMASWCPPCRAEMPELEIWQREHAAKGDAVLLTVADDQSDAGALRSYLRAHGATWPAVDDPAATISYGLAGLPTSFLVAPDGTVFAYELGQLQARNVDRWLEIGAQRGFGRA
jgi:thiol-disulfide isomerase/thioredoxin